MPAATVSTSSQRVVAPGVCQTSSSHAGAGETGVSHTGGSQAGAGQTDDSQTGVTCDAKKLVLEQTTATKNIARIPAVIMNKVILSKSTFIFA